MSNIAEPLRLCFKGSRTYLHGTDIFDALVDLTSATDQISFLIRRKVEFAVVAVPVPMPDLHTARQDKNICAQFQYIGRQGESECVLIKALPDYPVEGRYDYDEGHVTEGAQEVGANCLEQPEPTSYSFIERAVALNKRMLLGVYPEIQSWFFTRIDLEKLPDHCCPMKLCFHSGIGPRLVKSQIYSGDQLLGYIFFSYAGRKETAR